MNLTEIVLAHAIAFALVAGRLGGFVAVSPFPGEHVSVTQRVGLVCVAAYLVVTTLPTPTLPVATFDMRLLPDAAVEIGRGLVIGACFRFAFAAAEMLGAALSQAIGFGTPSLLNPVSGSSDTSIGTMVSMFAMLLALSIGAHRVALSYLLESFHALPLGGKFPASDVAGAFVNLGGEALAVGTRLATPALAISLAVQVTLAMIARGAPSLQIFSVGLAVLVATGLATLLATLPAIGEALVEHFGNLGGHLERLVTLLGG